MGHTTKNLTLAASCIAGAWLAASPTWAAEITVTTTADGTDDSDDCTLREALWAANNDTARDRCAAGDGRDHVVLGAGVYLLSETGINEDGGLSGDLDITSDVTVTGAGARTVINAQQIDRVLHIHSGEVELRHLTLRGGRAPDNTGHGGGIFNGGDLTLTGVQVIENHAGDAFESFNAPPGDGGGIFNNGGSRLDMTGCVISENGAGHVVNYPDEGVQRGGRGGGVYSAGDLFMTETTVSGNRTGFGQPDDGDPGLMGWGCGLYLAGTAEITRSTIDANDCTTDGATDLQTGGNGGGVAWLAVGSIDSSTISSNLADGSGGGVYLRSGELDLTMSTVVQNVAGDEAGGLALSTFVATRLLMESVTMVSNNITGEDGAGGLFVAGPGGVAVVMRNTLLANNTADGAEVDCESPKIEIASGGYNLVEDGSPNGCLFKGDTGTMIWGTNPGSMIIGDNGGPTLTVGLGLENAARDTGICTDNSGAVVAGDQRGSPRPAGPGCDIGAFERAVCGDSVLSMGEACDDANRQDGDGCVATCLEIESGFACDVPGAACTCLAQHWGDSCAPCDCNSGTCDDGLAGGGSCDCGGLWSGADCSVDVDECSERPTPCADGATCGNQEGGFTCACRDGLLGDGLRDGDGCTPTCGDRIVAGGETCDDGGLEDGDGCSQECATEDGYRCSGSPSDCVLATCGDSVLGAGESCDPGPSPSAVCDSDCTLVECGDGRVNSAAGEACDDENDASGDGCTSCLVDEGWACGELGNDDCAPVIGDGLIVGDELCDDGNTSAGDGCLDGLVEAGWLCDGEPSVCQEEPVAVGDEPEVDAGFDGGTGDSSEADAGAVDAASVDGGADVDGETPEAGQRLIEPACNAVDGASGRGLGWSWLLALGVLLRASRPPRAARRRSTPS